MLVAGSETRSRTRIRVLDAAGDPLAGVQLGVSSDLGTVDPVVLTDEAGWSEIGFWPGSEAGQATVSIRLGDLVAAFGVEVVPGAVIAVEPEQGAFMHYGDAESGDRIEIQIPGDAVEEPTTFAFTPIEEVRPSQQPGFRFAGQSFHLNAFREDGYQEHFTFRAPITLTLGYTDEQVQGLDETRLTLTFWDGDAWIDAATSCSPASVYRYEPEINQLQVAICHLSEFALFEVVRHELFLPAVVRD
jgi:hypothetical protein